MKEAHLKKLIKESELPTSPGFTDKVVYEIEKLNPPPKDVRFWSLRQIVVGFVLVAVTSAFLMYKIVAPGIFGNVVVPFVWSLFLLIGLNYLLSVTHYKSVLKPKT